MIVYVYKFAAFALQHLLFIPIESVFHGIIKHVSVLFISHCVAVFASLFPRNVRHVWIIFREYSVIWRNGKLILDVICENQINIERILHRYAPAKEQLKRKENNKYIRTYERKPYKHICEALSGVN